MRRPIVSKSERSGTGVDMANLSKAVCHGESDKRRFGNPPQESNFQRLGIMLLQPVILGPQNPPGAGNGETTEPRIRINRPDDENARCRVSRVRDQPKNFSQPTQPLTTLSTSNAISPLQKRTDP